VGYRELIANTVPSLMDARSRRLDESELVDADRASVETKPAIDDPYMEETAAAVIQRMVCFVLVVTRLAND